MGIFDTRRRKMEDYFSSLIRPVDPKRVEEVREAISKEGFWERTDEWRISTYITSRIEPFNDERGKRWYRVSVENGTDATCVCPTISRAVHYLALLERLTMDIFWTQGWSSWADKGRLEAHENEV